MTKTVNFDLLYREKGDIKKRVIKIDFVSNWFLREFSEVMAMTSLVKINWDKISDIRTEIAALGVEKTDGWKEKTKAKKAEIEKLNAGILEFSGDEFYKRRFELLKSLLIDNGVTDEMFLSFDFWDRQVEPAVMISLLAEAAYKDLNKKKRQ